MINVIMIRQREMRSQFPGHRPHVFEHPHEKLHYFQNFHYLAVEWSRYNNELTQQSFTAFLLSLIPGSQL